MIPCIGLFGTCGSSKWRNPFIDTYTERGILFYNPDKGDKWTSDDIPIESEHMAKDEIILFPVTNETYALGSLSEVGLSIMSTLRSDKERFVIVYIDMTLNDELKENALLYKESIRSRKLVYNHLKVLKVPGLFLVNSLEDMLEYSINLYDCCLKYNSMRVA